jgi:uncharacterized membrane protein
LKSKTLSTDRAQQEGRTQKLALAGLLTAIVIVLQVFSGVIRFGTFQPALALIPIIVGAATCGAYVSAWLGFVFGVVVLLNGDAALFMGYNAFGTILTVLLKGAASGFAAGYAYKLLEKKNQAVAVILAAIVAPVVNTGIFVLGFYAFFLSDAASISELLGFDGSPTKLLFVVLIGLNFFLELLLNLGLSNTVERLLSASVKLKKS